ncbi:MAG TPA: flavodoxin family protein [Candidatus Omnitrophota bacterium]|nr:flavodoxin family protein [Candidatus Omnitrophota bacterium]
MRAKKIIILTASPVKKGNTSILVDWFCEGALSNGSNVERIDIACLKFRSFGCISCRTCQTKEKYECVIKDDAALVLSKMADSDVIVMATPLYFFGPSAQLKLVMDRMFSLYKWDNSTNTMQTPLKNKKLMLIASAYEDIGLDALEWPFKLTADYTGMEFDSLLVPNAGESGEVIKLHGIREKAVNFGKMA